MRETGLLSGQTDPLRANRILENRDHSGCEIDFIPGRSQVGIDVVGEEIRKVPDVAGDDRPARGEAFGEFVRQSGPGSVVVTKRSQESDRALIRSLQSTVIEIGGQDDVHGRKASFDRVLQNLIPSVATSDDRQFASVAILFHKREDPENKKDVVHPSGISTIDEGWGQFIRAGGGGESLDVNDVREPVNQQIGVYLRASLSHPLFNRL